MAGETSAAPRPWWETRPFVATLILLSVVPLLYPAIPPLVDLLGHMGRYRVQLDVATSPWLRDYYDFRWAAIGNLGVDLLVVPLNKLFGLEPAVKLIVLTIPPMTVAGFLWVAREVHGRLPPTVLFALPFAYSHPFMFGFVNFALSMALAFLAFGLWLRLGRLGRLRLRAALFVPISIVLFFAHTFGWGALGLLCFSAEAVRQHDRGAGWLRSAIRAAMHASVMAVPALILLGWRSDIQGGFTGDWFNWAAKLDSLMAALRDRWKWFDMGAVLFLFGVVMFALASRRLGFSRHLAFSAIVLLTGFVLLPRIIFGSAYADMRLVPYVLAVAILAIRFRNEMPLRMGRALAFVGVGFVLLRLAGNTASLAMAAEDQRSKLRALDHVSMGARVLSLVGNGCGDDWRLPRNTHLGGMVIVRRHGLSNDQWPTAGANPLKLRYPGVGPFSADPSQIVRRPDCVGRTWNTDIALKAVPRDRFDYLWLIDTRPSTTRLLAGTTLVWSGAGSALYRIDRRPVPSATLRARGLQPAPAV